MPVLCIIWISLHCHVQKGFCHFEVPTLMRLISGKPIYLGSRLGAFGFVFLHPREHPNLTRQVAIGGSGDILETNGTQLLKLGKSRPEILCTHEVERVQQTSLLGSLRFARQEHACYQERRSHASSGLANVPRNARGGRARRLRQQAA
jgi:hypothetical protein